MKMYDDFEQLIELNCFVTCMNKKLLDKSIRVLKAERRRRIKEKINIFLNFNLFETRFRTKNKK